MCIREHYVAINKKIQQHGYFFTHVENRIPQGLQTHSYLCQVLKHRAYFKSSWKMESNDKLFCCKNFEVSE